MALAPSSVHTKRLKLYRQLSRLRWPRSYAGKLVLIASLGAHVPLLALIGYLAFAPLGGAPRWGVIAVAAFATVLGTFALRRAIRNLLAPVELTREALARYLDSGERHLLPEGYTDELGILMRDVDYAIDRFHENRLQLEEYAAFDVLTGLLNRRAAEDRLRQGFNLAERGGQPLCVAMLDLDSFKAVNDRYGHAAGDRLLAAVASQFTASVRGADWASRWGGEEFLLLLHTDAAGAEAALERLRLAVADLRVPIGPHELTCTISAGCAEAHPGDTIESVIHWADLALYDAKRTGRNHVCISEERPIRGRVSGE
jgi:diguanylate cyclase (GGDEF)-like protein